MEAVLPTTRACQTHVTVVLEVVVRSATREYTRTIG